MIKAVIFDLNGVFIQSKLLNERFAEDFGVANEKFMPALKKIMAQVRKPGAKSLYYHWKPYLKKWNVNLSKHKFYDYWFKAEKQVLEMTTLATEIKSRGIEIFILSNNFAERANYYKKNFPFLKSLPDKIYYSWKTGFIKPDPRAIKLILKENKLRPNECLYFDDSAKNIAVAKLLGIKSFMFRGAKKTKQRLNKFIKL